MQSNEISPSINVDPLYDQALNLIISGKLKNDIKAVQHHFRIGYNRATNLVEQIRANSDSLNKEI